MSTTLVAITPSLQPQLSQYLACLDAVMQYACGHSSLYSRPITLLGGVELSVRLGDEVDGRERVAVVSCVLAGDLTRKTRLICDARLTAAM